MPKPLLAVYANPYLHLDHEGRLAGACQLDPAVAGGFLRHIGASLDPARTKADPEREQDTDPRGGANLDTVWTFSGDEQCVEQTAHHLDRVRHGELFRAEADGGIPWLALADARLRAIAGWERFYGKAPAGMSEWPSQYPLDEQVAKVAEALVKKRASDAKAKDDTAERAAKAAKEAEVKAKAERDASFAKAMTGISAGLPVDKAQKAPSKTTEGNAQ